MALIGFRKPEIIMDGDTGFVPSRRSFLIGVGATLLVAPSIVRATSLMNIRGEPLHRIDFIPCNGQLFNETEELELFNSIEPLHSYVDYEAGRDLITGKYEKRKLARSDRRTYGGDIGDKTFAVPAFNQDPAFQIYGIAAPITYEVDRKGGLYMSIAPTDSMRSEVASEIRLSFAHQQAADLLSGKRTKI